MPPSKFINSELKELKVVIDQCTALRESSFESYFPSRIQIIEPHTETALAFMDGADTSFLIRKICSA